MPAQGSEDVWGHPAVRRVLDMREFLKAGSWRPFHETALQAPGLTAILAALHFAALRVAALAALAELEGCGEAAVRLTLERIMEVLNMEELDEALQLCRALKLEIQPGPQATIITLPRVRVCS